MIKRISELDSIRGIAALAVVVGHIYETFPFLPTGVSQYTPFKVLINGHAAVIMFFVLSGFVLMLPFLKGEVPYRSFIVKRVFRIYVPYVVAIFLAVSLSSLLYKGSIAPLGDYFNNFWSYHLNINLAIEHIMLVVNVHSDSFNPIMWTLIHEMRVSLIFPLIAFIVVNFNWRINLLICGALSVATAAAHFLDVEVSNGFWTAYTDTLHFSSFFIIGALLAKNFNSIVDVFKKLRVRYQWIFFASAFVLYNFSGILKLWLLSDYAIAVGAVIFIVMSVCSVQVSNVLLKNPLHFFGKISYSLYLYHFIVMLGVIHLLYGSTSIWLIYVCYFICTVIIACISWVFIEKPAMKLGRKLGGHMPSGIKAQQSKPVEQIS